MKCKVEGCSFYICVRGHAKMDGIHIKEFVGGHVYSIGDEYIMGKWRGRRMRATLLMSLIKRKVNLSGDYPP